MKKFWLILFLILCSVRVEAANYYISPTGSNSTDGLSSGAPWQTFAYAIPLLVPGDTLILMDGTYNDSNSGLPYISCGPTAVTGTASSPITLQAQNERQARIMGNGGVVIDILNCSYWRFIGLHVQNVDSTRNEGDNIRATYSHHLTFRRNLITNTNRDDVDVYGKLHGILLQYAPNDGHVIEENEILDFKRHGIVLSYSDGSVIRRNYCAARTYTGESCIAIYPGNNNIIENNISEGNHFELNATNGWGTNNNLIYGNIIIGHGGGDQQLNLIIDARSDTLADMPQNNFIKDFVSLNASTYGLVSESTKNTRCDNCSFITNNIGIYAHLLASTAGDGSPTIFSDNTLFLNNIQGDLIADQTSWQIDFARYFGNDSDSDPALGDSHITNYTTTDPSMGSCLVWIPDGSNLKGTGKNNGDIGANVLYEYVDGTLTSTPLWNTTTNKFVGQGALVTGVNDTDSLNDIASRLHIGAANGCAFPFGYAGITGLTDYLSPTGSNSNDGLSSGAPSQKRIRRRP